MRRKVKSNMAVGYLHTLREDVADQVRLLITEAEEDIQNGWVVHFGNAHNAVDYVFDQAAGGKKDHPLIKELRQVKWGMIMPDVKFTRAFDEGLRKLDPAEMLVIAVSLAIFLYDYDDESPAFPITQVSGDFQAVDFWLRKVIFTDRDDEDGALLLTFCLLLKEYEIIYPDTPIFNI